MSWFGWLLIGLPVVAVLLFAWVLLSLLPRVRRVLLAAERLTARAADAEALAVRLETLQDRVAEVQTRVEQVRTTAATRR